jgi:RNA recognition motif-containing protein
MVKIFVGGFPLDMQEIDLVKLVMPFGQVSTIKIVRDKKTRICKGYAFLEMRDQEAAEEVINNLDGYLLKDRALSIKIRVEDEINQKPPLKSTMQDKPAIKYFKIEKSPDSEKKKRPRKRL